ncbi:hypothetical protein VCHENC02_3500, partial [Vibrio harveyi]
MKSLGYKANKSL